MGFAFAQYIVRATLMLRGVIAGRIIGPEAFGAWSALQMMMEYGTMPLLGTQQGLDQMVPPRISAGDLGPLRRLKRAALFNIVLFTALFVVGCTAYASLTTNRLLGAWGVLGLVLALACVVCINLSNYQTSILRSHGDITTMSGWLLLQGAIGGVAGLALTPWLGGGACCGAGPAVAWWRSPTPPTARASTLRCHRRRRQRGWTSYRSVFRCSC